MVLAAGRGERMRPLTDTTPKPLLPVRGQPLLGWHLRALVSGGCQHLVVNTAWLGSKISSFFSLHRLTDGTFQLSNMGNAASPFTAAFSHEGADFGAALETAGGIARALPLLFQGPPAHGDVFWVVAGDVFVPGFVFSQASVDQFRASTALAHLWLVPNPAHNPHGDFGLAANGLALNLPATDANTSTCTSRHTYSTIGLYRPELFTPPWTNIEPGNPHGVHAALGPLLRKAMDAGRVSAELYHGEWTDVGTPQRLAQLNASP